MSRIWSGGAELQSASIEFSAAVTNAPAVETTIKRSGSAAWRIANTGATEGFRFLHASAQGCFFFRFYIYVVAMPTSTSVIGGFRTTGANLVSIRLTSGSLLQFRNSEDNAAIGSDSSAISTATWYRIEIKVDTT